LVNFLTHAPGISSFVKRLGGIAVERDVPRFAKNTFRRWYAEIGTRDPLGWKVILWPDTFNNFFNPEVAQAAVEVLEEEVLVHGHCHHRSIMGTDADQGVLGRMGAEYEVLATTCCGLAGSFG
jgi:Fe-S oxidoreductase